jgi:hypothetical protein
MEVKDWKTMYQPSGSQKQAGLAILISDKIDFKPKLVRRDKEDHYTVVKGTIHQQ